MLARRYVTTDGEIRSAYGVATRTDSSVRWYPRTITSTDGKRFRDARRAQGIWIRAHAAAKR
jgi:hypothetical protein